jgi:hypothetical protein
MTVYLGNIAIGNGNYLGNENITDNNIFVSPYCQYRIGQLVEGGVIAFTSPSGAIVLGLEDIGSGIMGCEGFQYEAVSLPVTSSIQINADTIGMGWYNTQNIITNCTASTAAILANDYTGSGYTDWCLANRAEWQQIYNNRVALDAVGANLGVGVYWQSVPFGPFPGLENNYALVANFSAGNMSAFVQRRSTFTVRPIRYLCDLTPPTPTTTTTTTTAAPTTTTTTQNPLQYWIVEPCGGGTQSSLAIDVGTTLTAGQAIRPVIQPGSTTPLAGYFTPTCWSLISTTTSGTYCGIRAPAASCAQSVCSVPNTTTTTTAAP